MSDIIIPDAIEPYLGYKALLAEDGDLVSPQQNTVWPHRQPLHASCDIGKPTFSWVTVPAPPGWEQPFWIPANVLKEGTHTFFSWPEQPPPPGHTQIPKREPHKLTGCQCGIYIADTPQQCHIYMRDDSAVLCVIAAWGEVVQGERGVRAEKAYPQKIFAAEQQAELVLPVADNYNVPVEIVGFYTDA